MTPIDFIGHEREQVIHCRGVPCLLFSLAPSPQRHDVAAEKLANVACTGNAGTARTLRMAYSFPEDLSRNLQRYLSDAALAAKLAIGVGLTVIAIRQYKKMGKPKPPKKPPRWQTGIDNMTPWYAIGLGPLTQPWPLVAAGVTVIVEAKVSSWESYLALALFCVIATSAFLAMEIYAGFRPQPAQQFLARLRHWIDTHTDQVIIIVSLVLGFWLIGNSIYYLLT